jgi:PEP-CTERM motif
MVRKLTVVIGLAMSLLAARDASAISIQLQQIEITPVDLDSWEGGSIVRSHTSLFKTGFTPSTGGEIASDVFFDGFNRYTYAHRVTSYLDFYSAGDIHIADFVTLSPSRFTGIAGWSFSDALRAGGTGTDTDFRVINDIGNNFFLWTTHAGWWAAFEPIQFFFVTGITRSCPSFDPHCSVGTGPFEIGPFTLPNGVIVGGAASSLTPVPEPGSIALLGSGLVGLYAAMRRRQRAKE